MTASPLEIARNRILSNLAKEVVRRLLESAGYHTHPLGRVSHIDTLKDRLYAGSPLDTPAANRVRSTPDLVVTDEDDAGHIRDLKVIEIKFREGALNEVNLELEKYFVHWPDAVLVCVVPGHEVFYAQYVDEIAKWLQQAYDMVPTEDVPMDLRIQFQRLPDLFPRVKRMGDKYDFYKKMATAIRRYEDLAPLPQPRGH
ncbi:MAG: hypothetical protein HY558_05565 [Euryarchaeota archaeon]|nr:hypothetical protein [Euryarchaeota archaeon]